MTHSSLSASFARKALAAAALTTVSVLGVGGVASAQDQHSGGVSSEGSSRDPGQPRDAEVLGAQVTRQSPLPVTGSDVAGLVAIGAGAVAIGAGAVVVSRREARGTSA